MMTQRLGYQIAVTGTDREKPLAEALVKGIGTGACSLAGKLSLEELIALIRQSPLLVSVNTGTIHIAAAVGTATVVLYALTNPQHAPWKNRGHILPFSMPESLQSRNEVLRYVQQRYFHGREVHINAEDVCAAVRRILIEKEETLIPELVLVPEESADEQHLVLPGAIELPE